MESISALLLPQESARETKRILRETLKLLEGTLHKTDDHPGCRASLPRTCANLSRFARDNDLLGFWESEISFKKQDTANHEIMHDEVARCLLHGESEEALRIAGKVPKYASAPMESSLDIAQFARQLGDHSALEKAMNLVQEVGPDTEQRRTIAFQVLEIMNSLPASFLTSRILP